jgi:hypothetical protein
MEATGRFGYDEKRIKEGEKVYRKVMEISDAQNVAMDRKVKAHDDRRKLQASVRKKYMKMLQISRIAFDKDIIIRKALQLDGPREVSFDAWLNQVSLFTNRLINEASWADIIKSFGISRKELSALLVEVDKLRSVALECEKSKADSKKETSLKKESIKVLQEWVSDYLKIAKIALEDKPELFVKLKE